MLKILNIHSIAALLDEAQRKNVAPNKCLIVATMEDYTIGLRKIDDLPIGFDDENHFTLARLAQKATASFAGWPLADVFLFTENIDGAIFFAIATRGTIQAQEVQNEVLH